MMVKTRDSNDIYILIDYKTEFFYSKKQNLYLYLKKNKWRLLHLQLY